ncbi:hypothetical protein HELRODRAFT_71776 [Helobdella robusta]|uniref:Uncharacterized protein n=1 Tax=Helobdella robusta TaxID=6412 RepID=T1G0R6_HELRO|nr:hypothetical protein HELRODRAFT_71776 [Helobdella robusta]ESO11652.1 hypothetical protein HELRODRAFT_71776 [Helobdella robusta]
MTFNLTRCHRLTHLMRVQHALDDTMNWLSTLGGAYSSLGEQDLNFAYLAGKKSEQQLRLALFLDIPPLVMRCKLFWALSLAQKKKFKRAEVIIRDQYESAKKLLVPDPVLLNMCKGIWSRLKYHKLAARGRCNGRWKCGDVADGVTATRLTSSITTEPSTPDVATNSIAILTTNSSVTVAANRTTASDTTSSMTSSSTLSS